MDATIGSAQGCSEHTGEVVDGSQNAGAGSDKSYNLERIRFQIWREGFDKNLQNLPAFCDSSGRIRGSSNLLSSTNGENTLTTSINRNPGNSSTSETNNSSNGETQTTDSPSARISETLRSSVSVPRCAVTVDPTNGPLTMIEEMISLFDQHGSLGVLFENETSIWTKGVEDLKKYLKGRIEFVVKKFKATPEIQSSFETYANIQISAAVALNYSRIAKRKAVQEVVDTRFQNIDEDLGHDWLSKSLAEVEGMYVNNDSCIQSLIRAFGNEWEAFYEKKKLEKIEPLFVIAKLLTEYKDELNNLLDTNFCCDKDKLESYQRQAYELIKPILSELSDSGRTQLNEKIAGIVEQVKNKVDKVNVERNMLDAQLSTRAVQYAVSRYCEAVGRMLGNIDAPSKMSESSLNSWLRRLVDHVSQCFFSVPMFVYTKYWQLARISLAAALEREEKQFKLFHSTNQLSHEMRIETAILSSVITFRRQVMELLSKEDEKNEFLVDTNICLEIISEDLKKQFPSTSLDYLLHLLCQKLQAVGEELKIEYLYRKTHRITQPAVEAKSSNNGSTKERLNN